MALQPGEYPPPTLSTVKELYGTAFVCAKPGCSRTLYRLDPETGTRTRNSEVAHIHARKPGGPRYIAMDPEANRARDNLLLLCLEHHAEVDAPAQSDLFPADLLRDWKKEQLADGDRRGSWHLTDDEAAEVITSLTVRELTLTGAGAGVLIGLTRAARRLGDTALAGRRGPAGATRALARLWEQTRASVLGYDEQGQTVYAEPPPAEQRRYRTAVLEALEATRQEAQLRLHDLRAETAALGSADPVLRAWCEWVDRAGAQIVVESSVWPDDPPSFRDSDKLQLAVAELNRAVEMTAARWRGEAVPEPPAPPEPPEPGAEPDEVLRLREHVQLLARARPYARVVHLPFDRDLQQALVEATAYAASLPPTADHLTHDLDTTAGLAVLVTRNASPAEQTQLLEQATRWQPLSAAVQLLRNLLIEGREAGLTDLAMRAEEACTGLLQDQDWQDLDVWEANTTQARWLLNVSASVIGPDTVRERLTTALTRNPKLLGPMLLGCASWETSINTRNGERDDRRHYERHDLPAWFPVDEVLAQAMAQPSDDAGQQEWRRLADKVAAAVSG